MPAPLSRPRLFAALVLAGFALVGLAAPAQAQWDRLKARIPIADLVGVSIVASDGPRVYATVLAGAGPTGRLVVVRSADDGDTWTSVLTVPGGGTRSLFFDEMDGRMALLVNASPTTTALFVSSDGGLTWAETAARIPFAASAVARSGETYLATGAPTTAAPGSAYRSTDAGATWTPIAGSTGGVGLGQPTPAGGAFVALNGIGFLYRLAPGAAAWTQVSFSPSAFFAGDVWADGGALWLKGSPGPLFRSADGGVTWAEQPAAQANRYTLVRPARDSTPWLLHQMSAAADVLLSNDRGATAVSVQAGYPRDDNGSLCTSNYAVSDGAVFGNAWACSFSDAARNDLFRYRTPTTAGESGAAAEGLSLAVGPNPAAGRGAVRVTLATAGPLRVTVVDALGREVARLHDGPARAGVHAFPLGAGLAPGVYVVRAAAGARAATATATVAR